MELLLKVFALCVITAAVASLLRRNEGELALLLALCAAAQGALASVLETAGAVCALTAAAPLLLAVVELVEGWL